jgi:hypothetical protein
VKETVTALVDNQEKDTIEFSERQYL